MGSVKSGITEVEVHWKQLPLEIQSTLVESFSPSERVQRREDGLVRFHLSDEINALSNGFYVRFGLGGLKTLLEEGNEVFRGTSELVDEREDIVTELFVLVRFLRKREVFRLIDTVVVIPNVLANPGGFEF